jgi:hypothetical protein
MFCKGRDKLLEVAGELLVVLMCQGERLVLTRALVGGRCWHCSYIGVMGSYS